MNVILHENMNVWPLIKFRVRPVPLPEVGANGPFAGIREGLFIKSYTRIRDYRWSGARGNFFNTAHHVQCNIFHQI